MRILVSATAASVLLTVCSCSTGDGTGGARSTADCGVAVRVDGVVYEEVGFTDRTGPEVGAAELSSCDDSGSGRGAYFADDAEKVSVVEIAGLEPDLAVGYADRGGGESLRVLVAASATDAMRQRVQDALASE